MSALSRLAVLAAVATPAAGQDRLLYNRDVRPILAENCFACHGPDSAARKADLRLDVRDQAVEMKAVVPGQPDQSGLVERIFAADDREVMPPPKSHKTLTAAQKATLKRWVAEGAEYQPHWSLIAPRRPAVPAVKDTGWVRTPIDAFVLAELEKRGLKPAPEADRRTIARRLSLDLVGLPPRPEDVEAFVADKAPDAYEKYVDRLLASPHWGEHRGRYWLDAARYADTHGIHFDNFREIWSYRDWVINAFNRNLTFDRFTVEQLAGDLLPNPTLDQRIATGFNRCNITTNEGGIIDEEYAVLYTRDRTETVNQVWMGLTAGCAVCHDHKFDPLTMREFYSMAAFFNNFAVPVRDGNIPNPAPIIPVPRAEDRARYDELAKELAAARGRLDARKEAARDDFAEWLKTADPADLAGKVPTEGLVLHAPLSEGAGKISKMVVGGKERTAKWASGYDWTTARADKEDKTKAFTVRSGPSVELADVGDFDRAQPFAVSMWLTISKRGTTGAVIARMDEGSEFRGWDVWLQADRVGMHLIHAYPQDALKVVATAPLVPGKWVHVTVAYDGSGKAAGAKVYYDGEPQPVDVENDALKSTTRTTVPLKIGQRHAGQRVNGVALSDLRVYDRPITAIDAQQLAGSQRSADILAKPAEKRTAKETDELFTWWMVNFDAEYNRLAAAQRKVQDEEVAIRGRGTIAHVAVEKKTPPEAYMLHRGEYDQRRDKVGPATPKVLPAFPEDLPKNRLGFARWLLRDDHPLTARVTVNRFWQELFGTGLVRTAGDFGVTGELPSHPELLDWLAVEFRTDWDVKRFFKLLVTSAAYRQSAAVTPEKLEKDRDNRLLSRGPRYRLDAEVIRDYALSASGLLVPKLGGPSVKPYQPEGVWEAVAMIGSNTRDYKRDKGESLYRRSLYTFWKRSAPPASMEVLNAPNRETCTVRRDRTNTPLQALVTLNDVQFVEAARHLATAAMKSKEPADLMARRLLARPLTAEEAKVVKAVYGDLRTHYLWKPAEARKLIAVGESKADPALDPSELAAWTMVANQLMNLDEVLNK
jgi:mono/diheme cytochrome c family protein